MVLAAVGIVCALAVVVLGQSCADLRAGALFAIGFAAAAAIPVPWLLPAAIALAAACAAALALWRPSSRGLASLLAGAIAACWAAVLQAQGLPPLAAPLLPLATAAAGAWLARSGESFANDDLRDEALLLVTALGVLVAAGPGVVDGYATAIGLRAMPLGESAVPTSAGALVFAGACILAGGLTAGRRRR